MKELKYNDIVTDNAETFDYEITEVAVKKGNDHLGALVKSELLEYVKEVKITTLDEKENADIVVTVGKDFK